MLNTIIKESKELWADKKIWMGILTVLIIIIIGTSYNIKNPISSVSKQLRLGVINEDESAYSGLLIDYFNSSETLSSLVSVVQGESDTILTAFDKGELDAYLKIPKDFAENMVHIEHSPITIMVSTIDTTKAILLQTVIKSYEKYISAVEANAVGLYEIMEEDGRNQELLESTNQIVSLDLILTALGKEAFFSYQPIEAFPSTTLLQYYLCSLLIVFLLYLGLYMGYKLRGEMRQGTLERLKTTGTPLYHFLFAKLIFFCVIFMVLTAAALSLFSRAMVSATGLLLCLAIAIFCISLATFLCALFPTTQSYVLAGNLIIFFFTILGGGIVPIQFLPQDMLVLSKFTPIYYLLRGILDYTQSRLSETRAVAYGFILLSVFLYGCSVFLLGRRGVNYEEA